MFSGLDLAGKFQAFKDFIEALYGTLFGYGDDLVRNTQDLAGSNEPYLLQLREAIGYLPEGNSIRAYLVQLLSNGLVTDTTNLETLRRTIQAIHFEEGGDDPYNLSQLYNLVLGFRQQVIGPTSPTIAQLLVDLNERLETTINQNVTTQEKFDTLIEEVSTIRLAVGLPSGSTTIFSLLTSSQECICRLANELAPEPPDENADILLGHACASEFEVLMIMRPADWVAVEDVGYVGTPSYIKSTLAGAFFQRTDFIFGSTIPLTAVAFDRDHPEYLPFMGCTIAEDGQLLELLDLNGFREEVSGEDSGWAFTGFTDTLTNLQNAAPGCESATTGGSDGTYTAFAFTIPDDGQAYPPAFTVVLYRLPAS